MKNARARIRHRHSQRTVIISAVVAALTGAGAMAIATAAATQANDVTTSSSDTSAAHPAAAPVAAPYSCAPNGPAGSQTIYGTFGDASVIGWTGNSEAVTACLGGTTESLSDRPAA